MKKRNLEEFKKSSIKDLDNELEKLMKKKLETEVAVLSGKEKNVKVLKGIRRDIAQILTLKAIIDGTPEKSPKAKEEEK